MNVSDMMTYFSQSNFNKDNKIIENWVKLFNDALKTNLRNENIKHLINKKLNY